MFQSTIQKVGQPALSTFLAVEVRGEAATVAEEVAAGMVSGHPFALVVHLPCLSSHLSSD
jgi:hypothetical protein